MPVNLSTGRPLGCLKSALRIARQQNSQVRMVSAGRLRYRAPPPLPPRPGSTEEPAVKGNFPKASMQENNLTLGSPT
jgi:hypothetical protein